ncbi:MAG: type II toxin-antitoxin system RelE/ParE family toxin [Oscillatoriales cyanobacterium RM1_1_9]|nr:type II toxin-antitoxin system RelE/ParE family toxin [Oscillatoriales cyanobacterium SM2_3_0]NJO45222.1 type II toxin-antitoxin system RelE/ParE family toxin [Oscillatoriales cyanobacterium RM2_1_1]NJO71718.1 type II toxin-antitoxin system RelE/ParE family toxin [Oscillatoriales cyanobacterium RM1_1_9]
MGYQVVWSPQAIDDIDAIAAYIARDSVSYAAAVVQRIIEVTRDLSDNPLIGDIVQEFGDEMIREQFAYTYRILYRIQDETVTVTAVIHGKRLLKMEVMG